MDGEQGNVVLDGEFECPDCGNGYNTEEERDNHRYLQGPPKNLPRSIYSISSIAHPNQPYCIIA